MWSGEGGLYATLPLSYGGRDTIFDRPSTQVSILNQVLKENTVEKIHELYE